MSTTGSPQQTSQDPAAAVLLVNPKFAHNVGGALRACAIFGADHLAWTAQRVPGVPDWPRGHRLPREERLRAYSHIEISHPSAEHPLQELTSLGYTPVAVEVLDHAETLGRFVHPERAVYVFGAEDGSLGRGVRGACHRFLRIPARG